MKLDVSSLRYLTKEHFRVLAAIEQGMRNHEVVPTKIVASIAKLRHGGIQKLCSHLLRNKLIAHDGNAYDGWRLTYSGYDFLALQHFLKRGKIIGLGRQIGVGKESDIFLATQEDGTEIAIKFHRLGRTSFRAVKNKRDYLKNGGSVNWFQMSKLSAMKEYAFLKALYDRGFPTPTPIDWNRHAICMSLVDGYPLYQVRRLHNSEEAYNQAMQLIVRLAEHGLVHCDFNEFNLLISDNGDITMIDFPQMISTSHPNAVELFNRDVNGVVKFFARLQKGAYEPEEVPTLETISTEDEVRVDIQMQASGYSEKMVKELDELQLSLVQDRMDEEENAEDSECEEVEDVEDEEDEESEEDIPELEKIANVGITDDIQAAEQAQDDEEEKATKDYVLSSSSLQNAMGFSEEELRIRVRKTLARKMKSGGRKSRNSAKLSIKGKLYHKPTGDDH